MHTRRLIMQDTSRAKLSAWLGKIQHRLKFNAIYILDPQGHDLLNRTLSPELQLALQNNTETTFDVPPHFRGPDSFRGPPPLYAAGMDPPGPAIKIKKIPQASGGNYTLLIDRQDVQENWRY